VDVLEQLHFLDDEAVNDERSQLCQLLRKHGEHLYFASKSGVYNGEREDIVKNLFKVCCGIQNFRLAQRGHNRLDENIFKSYMGSINYQHNNPDFVIMDQLNAIKSLINRNAYFLTHHQLEEIHYRFKNFYESRL
jgi:hypothetical protein